MNAFHGRFWVVVVLLAASLLISAASGAVWTVQVGPQNTFRYVPSPLNIATGDTVVWQWPTSGSVFHSVTGGNPAVCAPDNTYNSLGKLRGNFTYTFSLPGTYTYICEPHCSVGMNGIVIVSGHPPTTVPVQTLPPTPAPTGLAADFLGLEITFQSCPASSDVDNYLVSMATRLNVSLESVLLVRSCSVQSSPTILITVIDSADYQPQKALIDELQFLVSQGQIAPPPNQPVPAVDIVTIANSSPAAGRAALSALAVLALLLLMDMFVL